MHYFLSFWRGRSGLFRFRSVFWGRRPKKSSTFFWRKTLVRRENPDYAYEFAYPWKNSAGAHGRWWTISYICQPRLHADVSIPAAYKAYGTVRVKLERCCEDKLAVFHLSCTTRFLKSFIPYSVATFHWLFNFILFYFLCNCVMHRVLRVFYVCMQLTVHHHLHNLHDHH